MSHSERIIEIHIKKWILTGKARQKRLAFVFYKRGKLRLIFKLVQYIYLIGYIIAVNLFENN